MTDSAPVRLPLRERKKQSTRRLLIAESQQLFMTRGFRGTTLEDVADAADVTVRTLLRYFPTKEDLALALERQAYDRLVEALLARSPGQSALDVWEAFAVENARAWQGDGRVLAYQLFLTTDVGLLGTTLHLIDSYAQVLASHIAAEQGTAGGEDMAPWLAAETAVHGLFRLIRLWAAQPDSIDLVRGAAVVAVAARDVAGQSRRVSAKRRRS